MNRGAALATAVLALSVAAGCGDDDDPEDDAVVISAASSLETAFTEYAETAGVDAKQSFAGSDALAAQIRAGITPDVYAAANTSLPDELHADGLAAEPIEFATNELVLAVPDGSTLEALSALGQPGLTLAIGDEGVPVGDYTREVLGGLDPALEQAILDNVRSLEPDVAGIVGKLTQGAVDAGFVYITDVVATDGALEAVELPPPLAPEVAYGAVVVEGAENAEGAESFIDGLLEGPGADALANAGFGPPPE